MTLTNEAYILNAPAKGGLRREFDTLDEAMDAAAELLGVSLAGMVTEDASNGGAGEDEDRGVTYCYESDEAAAGDDGSYAVNISRGQSMYS